MNDRDAVADWLLSTRGRLARILLGTVLILIGLGVLRGGILGILLLLIGAVLVASAAYGTLLIGPLLGRDTRGRRPQDQPEEDTDEGGEDASSEEEDDATSRAGSSASADDTSRDRSPESGEDEGAPQPDPDWSAPPVARAERPPGQEPRTRDLRAEQPSGD
jgi:hypothetical protein